MRRADAAIERNDGAERKQSSQRQQQAEQEDKTPMAANGGSRSSKADTLARLRVQHQAALRDADQLRALRDSVVAMAALKQQNAALNAELLAAKGSSTEAAQDLEGTEEEEDAATVQAQAQLLQDQLADACAPCPVNYYLHCSVLI